MTMTMTMTIITIFWRERRGKRKFSPQKIRCGSWAVMGVLETVSLRSSGAPCSGATIWTPSDSCSLGYLVLHPPATLTPWRPSSEWCPPSWSNIQNCMCLRGLIAYACRYVIPLPSRTKSTVPHRTWVITVPHCNYALLLILQVSNNECMLVGLGAYKAIGGVATGDVLGRLHQATAQVQGLDR